jgi:hypothetical protein
MILELALKKREIACAACAELGVGWDHVWMGTT